MLVTLMTVVNSPRWQLISTSLIGILSLLLVSCGKKDADSPNPETFSGGKVCSPVARFSTTGAQSLQFDSSVPSDQKALFQKDISRISQIQVGNYTQAEAANSGLPDFSPNSLSGWIQSRVKYIVGQNYSYADKATVVSQSSYNPSVFADQILESSSLTTIMANVGSAVYRVGKKNSYIYSLPVAWNSVQVKSPRVGIIQIGSGLFDSYYVKNTDKGSFANSLIRLTVLFHEGRHSDGNGTNAGFPHAMCESGDFKGSYSCENNINGPYAVDAITLKVFKTACTNCTNTELETFNLFQLDSESRIMSTATCNDERPEQIQ